MKTCESFCWFFIVLATSSSSAFGASIKPSKNVKVPNVRDQKIIMNAVTMGMVLGTRGTQERMRSNLLTLLQDFLQSFTKRKEREVQQKFQHIEAIMQRDRMAIEILNQAMQMAMKSKTVNDFRVALKKGNQQVQKSPQVKPAKDMKAMMQQLKKDVSQHLREMQAKVDATVQKTIASMDNKKERLITSLVVDGGQLSDIFNGDTHHVAPTYFHVQAPMICPLHYADVESFYRFRRQNEDGLEVNQVESPKESDEDFDFESPSPATGGGGLTGLIASLSGGEGGMSDVGALVGAISGVITSLFGPGGLDLPSLLGSGTSLLAGLLGGDDNFGKVLASYIGISVDGLSGGGGADLNGEFFGNFVGTLFSQLSADPEEDDVPPKPKIFLEGFVNGFEQTKQKRGTDEMPSGNRRSYFAEFISNIISSLVGGITNLIVNSSVGSSGGSSQGSASLSSGSSQGSAKGSSAASQMSSMGSMTPSKMPK